MNPPPASGGVTVYCRLDIELFTGRRQVPDVVVLFSVEQRAHHGNGGYIACRLVCHRPLLIHLGRHRHPRHATRSQPEPAIANTTAPTR
jgi:hypothetical protein